MPATMVVVCGLVHPPPWCGQRFPAVGQRVKNVIFIAPSCIHFHEGDLDLPEDPLSLLPDLIRDGTFAFFKVNS